MWYELPEDFEPTRRQMINFAKAVRTYAGTDIQPYDILQKFDDLEAGDIGLRAAITARWLNGELSAVDDLDIPTVEAAGIECLVRYVKIRMQARASKND